MLAPSAWLLLAFLAPAPLAQVTDIALTGAILIDGTERPAVAESVVLIRKGKIVCAGTRQRCSVPRAMRTLDVSGKFITPGLVDAHVHMGQTGWLDGRPDGLKTNVVYPYPQTIADLRAHPDRWHK